MILCLIRVCCKRTKSNFIIWSVMTLSNTDSTWAFAPPNAKHHYAIFRHFLRCHIIQPYHIWNGYVNVFSHSSQIRFYRVVQNANLCVYEAMLLCSCCCFQTIPAALIEIRSHKVVHEHFEHNCMLSLPPFSIFARPYPLWLIRVNLCIHRILFKQLYARTCHDIS